MKHFILKQLTKNDNLLFHSSIMIFGSAFAKMLNYLLQIILGRHLGPKSYGVYGSVIAFVTILLAINDVLSKVIVKYVSKLNALRERARLSYLLRYLLRLSFSFGILLGIAILVLCKPIASYLRIQPLLLVPVAAIPLFSFLGTFVNGVFVGLERFVSSVVYQNTAALVRFCLALLFIFLGYNVLAQIAAIPLATMIAAGMFMLFILSYIKPKPKRFTMKQMVSFAIPVALLSLATNLMLSIDVLMVKHYFESHLAGYYNALVIFGKIVLFAAMPIGGIVFPKASKFHAKKQQTMELLRSGMVYTGLIVAAIVLVYFVAPTFIVNLVYGSAYKIAGILGFMGVAYGLITLNWIMASYNLAVERYSFIPFIYIGLIAEVFAIAFFHSTLLDVVKVVIIIQTFIFVALTLISFGKKGLLPVWLTEI